MTVKELSEYLRLDRMTIYKMLREGSIPASRVGHQWRFFRADIDEWIRSLRTGRPVSALVASGDPAVRQIFDAGLSAENFEVFAVVTGEEAAALAAQRQFGLIFLDLRKATTETFRQLRTMGGSTPIVIVANSSDMRAVDEATEVGAFILMRKPRSGADVKRVLPTLPLAQGKTA